MKKLSLFILSIFTFITCLFLIISLSLDYTLSRKSISHIIKNVEVTNLLQKLKIRDELYQIANYHQINQEDFDQLLSSKKANDYISSLTEEVIHYIVNQEDLSKDKIYLLTSTFLDTIKLDDQLINSVSSLVYERLNQATLDIHVSDNNFIYIITNSNVKTILFIAFILEIIFIIFVAWHEKNFFAYFGFVSLFLTITTFLFVFIFKLGFTSILKNNTLISLVDPIISGGYQLSIILFIITASCFLIQKILTKYITDYANIPF